MFSCPHRASSHASSSSSPLWDVAEVCCAFDRLFPQHSHSLSRSHPQDLGYIERGVDLSFICWRVLFHDLSNLQLTPLKVSYDLIEADYGDNSIIHNHVGSPNSRLQIEFELHCLGPLTTCRFLFVMSVFMWVCFEFWWSRGAHIWSGLVSGPRWCSWGSLL